MKIGINCSSLLNPGYGKYSSAGHYVYYLVSELLLCDERNSYVLYFDSSLSKDAVSRFISKNRKALARSFPFHSYGHELRGRYLSELFRALVERDRLDVFHEMSPEFAAAVPGKTVFTVNDISPWSRESGRGSESKREEMKKNILAANKLIVPTKFTKHEIGRYLPGILKKVAVIPPGLDISSHHVWTEDVLSPSDHLDREELRGMFKLRGKFILSISTIGRDKNQRVLLDAYRAIWKQSPHALKDIDLVFAGAKGNGANDFFRELEKANKETGGKVRYLGYVTNQAKFALLENAHVFVFLPSYEGGFAFLPMEAAALGTPVLVSNLAPFKETLGKAAVFANPQNFKEVSAELFKLLENEGLRQKLTAEGNKLPGKLSWKKTAEETLKIYEKI